ncbi:hypothetical protein YC2023_051323 [Brassica napus]
MVSGLFRNGAMGDVVPHGSKVMRFPSLDSFEAEKKNKKKIKRGATRGLPGRSPILVLLPPKHASLQSSDGIRCISAGMILPVSTSHAFPYIICLANPCVRPWGPHDFLTRNSASRLMALREHQKQPENQIGILFYVPYLSAARLRVKTAEFGAEKLPSLFTALYGIWAFPKWSYGRRSSSRFKSYEISKFRLV